MSTSYLAPDVLQCSECGHLFRDTHAERGWRVANGRVTCQRCVLADEAADESLIVPTLLLGLAVVAIVLMSQSALVDAGNNQGFEPQRSIACAAYEYTDALLAERSK